jgi:hypothetical protein
MTIFLSHWIMALTSLLGAGGMGVLAFFFPTQALGILKWFMELNLAQIGCIVLAIALVIDHLGLLASHRAETKTEAQLTKCSNANKKLAAQSKVEIQQVTKTVDHYITVTKPVVRKLVQQIETAPLPGHCVTPKEVLNADV